MSTVELCGIEKSLGGQSVLRDLSLQVQSGQYLVVLGPSGCGKTTTLRIVAGLESPGRGKVVIDDRDVTGIPPRHRDVSMVFQNDGLYPHLTIGESIGFGLKSGMTANEREQRVRDSAALVSLDKLLDRMPHQLSGGQLRRAAIAKAVARRATVRLLDEPLSAIDAPMAYMIEEDLRRWHETFHGTTIHVTHDGGEAMRLADQIALMQHGRLTQIASPDELYAKPANISVARAVGLPPMNLFPAESSDGQLVFANELIQHQGRLGESAENREVIVGVRPQDWRLMDAAGDTPDTGDRLRVHAKLGRIRRVEHRWLAVFCLGKDELSVTLDASRDLTDGNPYTLLAPTSRVHLFDAETGFRIPCASA